MKKFPLVVLMVVLVTALVFGGCAKPAAPEEILIGSSESVTGVFSGFGVGSAFGLKAGVEDINKQGGVYVEEYGRKLPVKLVLVDNESDPAKAGTLASDLILRDKVHVLANGPGPINMFMPISVIAERNKIPYLAGWGPVEPFHGARMAAEPPWEYIWANGFDIVTPPPPEDFRSGKPGYSLVDVDIRLMDKFADQHNSKVAMFASDDPDSTVFYKIMGGELLKRGFDVCGYEKGLGIHPIGTMDFTSIIEEWKDYGCEVMWGNAVGPDLGTLWRQCKTLGFRPKMCQGLRSSMFYEDIIAWGGDLPLGVLGITFWNPNLPPEHFPGIGGTTSKTAFDRWYEETGKPSNWGIGWGYAQVQVIADAIERAGTLDPDKLNKAIGETDLMTLVHRMVFNSVEHHSRIPVCTTQWHKTDPPWLWKNPIVLSMHDFIPAEVEMIFPLPPW